MNKFIPSFFQCILLGIVILATACQSEKLPNGTFIRQDATPETFIGLEVKDDTLIWKQDAGKLYGNYIQYNAVPKNTVHIIIKGDSITKIQTHYDQPLHTISAQYILDDKQCLIHIQLREGKQSFVFRPCPDGFILNDCRFVKEQ